MRQMSFATPDELLRAGALAMQFMVMRYGPVTEASDRDVWHERLGLVIDAYHEMLTGGIRMTAGTLDD